MNESAGRAEQYSKSKITAAVIGFFLAIAFLTFWIWSGASRTLREQAGQYCSNFYLQAAVYIFVFFAVYLIVFAGLDYYSGYTLEHRFSLSNQTVTGWLKKYLKKGLLSLLLFIGAGEVLYLLLRKWPDRWYVAMAAAWVVFAIVLGKILPTVIIPLFYKCKPLSNVELTARLTQLAKKCEVAVKDVFEIGLSEETQKANAAVAGFGKNRRILMGDTLITNFSLEEIEAIFAHELGHVKMRHIWKMLAVGTVIALINFYVADIFLTGAVRWLDLEGKSDIAGLPFILLVLMFAGLIIVPIQNFYIRLLERHADLFALQRSGPADVFISAMFKLGEQNLANAKVGWFVKTFFYDHPPILERIAYLKQAGEKKHSNA